MQWKPNVTVAAIAEQDNYFLVVEEDANSHIVFNQPAGHLEKNETLISAVKREVLEETAWDFEPESIVGIYMYPDLHSDIPTDAIQGHQQSGLRLQLVLEFGCQRIVFGN